MLLGPMLVQSSRRTPDRVALWFGDRGWTYAALNQAADQVAATLNAAGLRPGERLALFLPNCPELVLSYFACFKLGVIAVPLNYRYREAEAQYALEHSESRALVVHETLVENVEKLPLDRMGVTRRYLVGAGTRPGFAQFAELFEAAGLVPEPAFDESQPAAILYTSGTTAKPKGVTYTHGTLWHNCLIQAKTFAFIADDVHLISTAACHAAAFTGQLLPNFFVGGTCVLTHLPVPQMVIHEIARRGVTRTQMLPASLEDLVEELEQHPRTDLATWRSPMQVATWCRSNCTTASARSPVSTSPSCTA